MDQPLQTTKAVISVLQDHSLLNGLSEAHIALITEDINDALLTEIKSVTSKIITSNFFIDIV